MIVEKTHILYNGRIIKYLSAHSLNGNTIYCQESKRMSKNWRKMLKEKKITNQKNRSRKHSNTFEFEYVILEKKRLGENTRISRASRDIRKTRETRKVNLKKNCRKYVYQTVTLLILL